MLGKPHGNSLKEKQPGHAELSGQKTDFSVSKKRDHHRLASAFDGLDPAPAVPG
jgi:hypothetical protein